MGIQELSGFVLIVCVCVYKWQRNIPELDKQHYLYPRGNGSTTDIHHSEKRLLVCEALNK